MICRIPGLKKDYIKNGLEVHIKLYENGTIKPILSNRQKISDITAQYDYEYHKVMLQVYNKRFETYMEAINSFKEYSAYYRIPDIRMRACALVSQGRTLKITELDEEELNRARAIIEQEFEKQIEEIKSTYGIT